MGAEFPSETKRLYGKSLGVWQMIPSVSYSFTIQRYNHIPFIIKVSDDGVWTSAPLAVDEIFTGRLSVLRSDPDNVQVSYSLAGTEVLSEAEVEIRDFNNNLMATERCENPEGIVNLYSNEIRQGCYVVSLREDGCQPVYIKLIIK
jgi:hypothetical protein